jgi:hypothetical protein
VTAGRVVRDAAVPGGCVIESEWLAATDPAPMLEFLRGKVSDRKFRLFACAYSRVKSRSLRDLCLVELNPRPLAGKRGPFAGFFAWPCDH